MINRIIIRIKILQIIYSFYSKGETDCRVAENELMYSIEKTYDLYRYLLLLVPFTVNFERKRIESKRNFFRADAASSTSALRFVHNRVGKQLSENKFLLSFSETKGFLWDEDFNLIRNLVDRVLNSDTYKEYLESEDSYDSDKNLWRKIYKYFILDDESIVDFLEDKNVYWNDGIDVIGTFVIKTIKKFEEKNGREQEIMPMFKDEEDREFAVALLRESIQKKEMTDELIKKHIKNWDLERIAGMDLYIMQMAISEILSFPSIPVSVTLNEYIEIAKYYSSPKSNHFINGILDSIVMELKNENKLFKN